MDYSSSSNQKLDPAKRDEFMNEVKQQLAIASAQELLQVSQSSLRIYFSIMIR